MNKLCIHYPNKSDKETYQICTEVYFISYSNFFLTHSFQKFRSSKIGIDINPI
jgi:hypothetical protein